MTTTVRTVKFIYNDQRIDAGNCVNALYQGSGVRLA